MAAEDEGRTEEPSEHRLEQARKEGRVAKSQDISSALILLLGVVVLIFLGKWILSQCINIFVFYFFIFLQIYFFILFVVYPEAFFCRILQKKIFCIQQDTTNN